MLNPGGLGTYIGDVNMGGWGAGSKTDMAIRYMGDVHIMGRVGEFWDKDKHWIC